MSNDDLLREISQKLSVLISLENQQSRKLSALISLEIHREGKVGVQEFVARLSRLGLSTSEIAEILNTTAGTVAVSKSRIKRKSKE